jgi:hypothetical protein
MKQSRESCLICGHYCRCKYCACCGVEIPKQRKYNARNGLPTNIGRIVQDLRGKMVFQNMPAKVKKAWMEGAWKI